MGIYVDVDGDFHIPFFILFYFHFRLLLFYNGPILGLRSASPANVLHDSYLVHRGMF